MHPPALLQGGTIGWPRHSPVQHLLITCALLKHVAQVALSGCMPLICCKAEESRSLGVVLRNTLAVVTVIQHEAQEVLSGCMPLLRCKAIESHSLVIVFRNAATTTHPMDM